MSTTKRAFGWVTVAGLILACGDLARSEPQSLVLADPNKTISRVPNPPLASDLANLPGDLRVIAVPGPANIGDFVKNSAAAIVLGKALFWDMQVGSDGVQACASCHFRAGADPRSKNQLSPGLKVQPIPDLTFFVGGANFQLSDLFFPLTQLAIPGVRGALDPAKDNNDSISSMGVHHLGLGPDPQNFRVGDLNTRRVEPRNTPTMINAVFNHRQFWDGRAENVFNGVDHRGTRNPDARVFRADDPDAPVEVAVALANSSLASQAVAPIVANLEMARPNRTVQEVGRELVRNGVRPLKKQRVHPSDSVLGPHSRYPAKGLRPKTYAELIGAAFHNVWWDSPMHIRVLPDGTKAVVSGHDDDDDEDDDTTDYTLMQYNFSLFFGLAVQAYERTLVSDDTPWDRFRRENPAPDDPDLNPWTNTKPNHISRLALFGAHLFNDRTRGPTNLRCSNCHEQAELTDASNRRVLAAVNGPVRNRDGNIIDKGFNNIGLRPTDNDLGAGATDAFGHLSHTRRLFPGAAPATFDGAAVTKGFGVQGSFKIPSLRNVALTAPFFHNGDALTLHDAVTLYSRGGNVAPINTLEGVVVEPLGVATLSSDETDAVVAWLETLTDERVLFRRAPFDHPQLFVPNGHTDECANDDDDDDEVCSAEDVMLKINAVGAAGGAPLPGFLEGPFGP